MIKHARRLLLLGVLFLAGCGASNHEPTTTASRSPTKVASCLNSTSFLVEAGNGELSGSSPTGVNFTLKFFSDLDSATKYAAGRKGTTAVALPGVISSVVLDDNGNPPEHPGGPPARLADVDVRAIFVCVLHR